VVTEVLDGARSDARENDLRRLLLRFERAAVDPTADFEAAASIYRRCRRAGFVPATAPLAHGQPGAQLAWMRPMTLPSASITDATSLWPPTSWIAWCSTAPAVKSSLMLLWMLLTCQ